jgi:hypothetical protein
MINLHTKNIFNSPRHCGPYLRRGHGLEHIVPSHPALQEQAPVLGWQSSVLSALHRQVCEQLAPNLPTGQALSSQSRPVQPSRQRQEPVTASQRAPFSHVQLLRHPGPNRPSSHSCRHWLGTMEKSLNNVTKISFPRLNWMLTLSPKNPGMQSQCPVWWWHPAPL